MKKIILKENGLGGSDSPPTGYKYIGDELGVVSQKVGLTTSAIGGGGSSLPYKVYTATVTQTSTDAPVSVVLQNTFDSLPTWSYFSDGIYQLVFAPGTFTDQDKVWIYSDTRGGEAVIKIGATPINDSTIQFNVLDGDNTGINDAMYKAPIEIRFYN